MPRLVVTRPTAFRDRLRAYRIFVDGTNVGDVRAGGQVELEISPGRHRVEARVDWCSSTPLSVEASGEPIRLEVGSDWSSWNPFELLARLTWKKNEYLYVRKA